MGASMPTNTTNRQGLYVPRDAIAALLIFFAIAFAPALIGSAFAPDLWYESLNKPSWNPPGWLFGPVWTVLYLLIGYAGYLAWSSSIGRARQKAFWIFALQMILNALWTPLFFGLHSLGLSLVNMIALWLMILLNAIVFYRLKPAAGLLLTPYLLWVTFALVLNATIWWLNR